MSDSFKEAMLTAKLVAVMEAARTERIDFSKCLDRALDQFGEMQKENKSQLPH